MALDYNVIFYLYDNNGPGFSDVKTLPVSNSYL